MLNLWLNSHDSAASMFLLNIEVVTFRYCKILILILAKPSLTLPLNRLTYDQGIQYWQL